MNVIDLEVLAGESCHFEQRQANYPLLFLVFVLSYANHLMEIVDFLIYLDSKQWILFDTLPIDEGDILA